MRRFLGLFAAAVAPVLVVGVASTSTAVAAPATPSARMSDPMVKLVNRQTGKCLTIAGGVSTNNNLEAVQFDCDGHPSRYWILQAGVVGAIQVKNVQTGKCLTIAGGVSTNNNVTAVQFTCDGHPSRSWFRTQVGTTGYYELKNVQTGKCLTIAGGVSTNNNLEAVQFTCDGHPSRFWFVAFVS